MSQLLLATVDLRKIRVARRPRALYARRRKRVNAFHWHRFHGFSGREGSPEFENSKATTRLSVQGAAGHDGARVRTISHVITL